MIRVHVGCGKRNFGTAWLHVDGGDYNHLDGKDIFDLPCEDGSADLIYASHLIAYFDRVEIIPLLKHWFNKLKVGGTLRLATPDFIILACMYCDGSLRLDQLLGPLYGKMAMGEQIIYHKTVYDRASLTKLLESVGFHGVRDWDFRHTEHAEFDDHSKAHANADAATIASGDFNDKTLISLNLEATK